MSTTPTPRTPRADAARNRARLLEVAERMFDERGLDVSVAEIAREAGVGQGTAFRHFPSKAALIEAMLLGGVEQLVELANAQLEIADPWEGLAGFLTGAVRLHVRHRGYFEAVRGDGLHGGPALAAARTELVTAAAQLLDRAQASGDVRGDLGAGDIPLLVIAATQCGCGVAAASGDTAWQRPLAILLDGIRADAATAPLPGSPPDPLAHVE